MNVSYISGLLAQQVERLCRELLPHGHREGNEWRCGSVNGEPGRSLGVHLAGEKAGLWRDFGSADKGGDLVDLVQAVLGLDKGEAVLWAKNWLGIDDDAGQPGSPAIKSADQWQPITPIPPNAARAPDHPTLGSATQRWAYREATGGVLMLMARFDPPGGKKFRPLTFCRNDAGQCEWRWQALPPPRPLLGLDQLAQRAETPVLVVEGEKAAAAAMRLLPDYTVTTWPHGGKSVHLSNWSPLWGRRVTVWPDNDKEGEEAAQKVARECRNAGVAEVRIVELPEDLPLKWDLADPLPNGWTLEDVRRLLDAAPTGLLSVLSVPHLGVSAELPPLLPNVPTMPESMLPDSLRPWLLDVAERAQIPLEYVSVPAVVALGSLIGRTVGIRPKQHDDWLVIPNLWGGIIGRPGLLKSPAVAEAVKPLRRLAAAAHEDFKLAVHSAEAEGQVLKAKIDAAKDDVRRATKAGSDTTALQAQLADFNARLEAAKIHERRYIVNEATTEKLGELLNQNPRGLLLVRDELAGWLKSLDRQGREGDREFYLEAWNGSGRFTYDRIGRGTVHIDALCLSIIGTIQPGKLQAYIAGALQGGGGCL